MKGCDTLNYNSIEVDEEYAYVRYRNRGVYPINAKRGTVLDKRKRKQWHNRNMTGEVLFEYEVGTNEDGSPIMQEEWISAYNVIDYWDRYEDEREHLYGERIRKEELARQEAERRRLEIEEMRRAKEVKRKTLEEKILVGLRLPKGSVQVLENSVMIDLQAIEERLGEWTVQ